MTRWFRSSRPESRILPRSHRDQAYHHMSHGPILPLEEPTFFERLFGRR